MWFGADGLGQLGVDQFLECFPHQIPEQKPDLVTAKLCDELTNRASWLWAIVGLLSRPLL